VLWLLPPPKVTLAIAAAHHTNSISQNLVERIAFFIPLCEAKITLLDNPIKFGVFEVHEPMLGEQPK
jgi:hypothetical protein